MATTDQISRYEMHDSIAGYVKNSISLILDDSIQNKYCLRMRTDELLSLSEGEKRKKEAMERRV